VSPPPRLPFDYLKQTIIRKLQKVLPLTKVALEAHAFRNWKLAMTRRSICLPDPPTLSHVRRYSLLGLIEVGNEPIALQERQQFLESRFRLLNLLNQPCPVHIVTGSRYGGNLQYVALLPRSSWWHEAQGEISRPLLFSGTDQP
jgi:hypothetical protein